MLRKLLKPKFFCLPNQWVFDHGTLPRAVLWQWVRDCHKKMQAEKSTKACTDEKFQSLYCVLKNPRLSHMITRGKRLEVGIVKCYLKAISAINLQHLVITKVHLKKLWNISVELKTFTEWIFRGIGWDCLIEVAEIDVCFLSFSVLWEGKSMIEDVKTLRQGYNILNLREREAGKYHYILKIVSQLHWISSM